jgi:hypothetical protein
MCGTNSESQLKLVNGVDRTTSTGGTGDATLWINGGLYGHTSDFAIAELVVWPRGLTSEEMYSVSAHLMDSITSSPPAPPTGIAAPSAFPGGMVAWYCCGMYDIGSGTWPDVSGNGNTATLSGSGFTELSSTGHGANAGVLALSGTTSSQVSFGNLIEGEFTVCSVTRYTGGTKRRILQGGDRDWFHGHWSGRAGVAYYQGWKTSSSDNVNPDTNWVVMCGTNAGSQLKLANGRSVGTSTGGTGSTTVWINGGYYSGETSDFAIADLVVWPPA